MKDLPAMKWPSASDQKQGDTQAQLSTTGTHVLSPGVQNQPVSLAQSFVKGELIENKDGATYEGIVYDRWLTFRLPDGHELTIFDFLTPSRESLSVNVIYEIVLLPFVTEVDLVPGSLSPAPPDFDRETSRWQGLVVDLDWQARQNAFRFVNEELSVGSWALVETPLGHIIMATEDIREPLQVGTVIQWECAVPYLYAVV